jgi:hypothetical protein
LLAGAVVRGYSGGADPNPEETMFAALTLALALAPAQGDAIALKWNLKPGDTFYSKNTTAIEMQIGVAGQMIDQKQDITAVMRYKVKSAEGDGIVLEMTYVEMQIKMTGPAAADTSAVTNALKGATVTATLDKAMKVTKIDGRKKLVDDLAQGDPGAKAMLGAMLSEDAMKQMFSTLFALTPEKPVKVGDTWTSTDTLDAGGIGKITAKTKFKLAKASGDTATIDTTADMTFKAGDGEGLPFKITKADFKIEKFTGSNTFDVKAGRLKDAKSEMTMSGSMTIGVMGQEVDATLTQKVKSTSVVSDKNPVKD